MQPMINSVHAKRCCGIFNLVVRKYKILNVNSSLSCKRTTTIQHQSCNMVFRGRARNRNHFSHHLCHVVEIVTGKHSSDERLTMSVFFFFFFQVFTILTESGPNFETQQWWIVFMLYCKYSDSPLRTKCHIQGWVQFRIKEFSFSMYKLEFKLNWHHPTWKRH